MGFLSWLSKEINFKSITTESVFSDLRKSTIHWRFDLSNRWSPGVFWCLSRSWCQLKNGKDCKVIESSSIRWMKKLLLTLEWIPLALSVIPSLSTCKYSFSLDFSKTFLQLLNEPRTGRIRSWNRCADFWIPYK